MESPRRSPEATPETAEPLREAARWLGEGAGVSLATVVSTWGSSPRPAGSQLAVREGGDFVGSVSGGCVEGAVVEQALQVMESGASESLSFGVTDEMAWEVGLACGGQVRIYVERFADRETLDALLAARARREPRVWLCWLDAERRSLLTPGELSMLDPEIAQAARDALRGDAACSVESAEGPVFLQPLNPPLRLVVVGAVHIAQHLAGMAKSAGYAVTVVDPRGAFASEARFPGVELSRSWPGAALAEIGLDARSALVTLSHDPKIDEPALEAGLASEAFYVGSLGSRRTHARRLERLRALGLGDDVLSRIHGPVGLDIGARSPAEIAVSILAQVTEVLRARPA